MLTKHITRTELLDYSNNFDEETKQYCLNDCIKTWDDKNLWEFKPIAFINDNNELVCIIFYNYIQNNNIMYIQRLFTPLKFQKKGYFTNLLTLLYEQAFNYGCKFIQMFIKPSIGIYKQLNFIPLFDTVSGYQFCLTPVLCRDLQHNNQLVVLNKTCNFYNECMQEYINTIRQKYA